MVADPLSLIFANPSAASPRSDREPATMSGTWDRDEAGGLRRVPVRQAPRRDLRLPAADAARPGARRRPDPGRVHQGVQELRDAREARERAGLAVPDRPSRGARRDPPPQDHPVPPVDRRIAGSAPSAERPGHGRPPVGRHAAGAGQDPGTPARRPPARRAPRPHRPRARRGARRQPRRRPRPPDPRPREPPPGARRRARPPRPRPTQPAAGPQSPERHR